MSKFDPKKDIPDLGGKVILITGGTAGVGAGTLIELAHHNPSHLLFTGRNQNSAEAIIAKLQAISSSVKVSFIQCDLSDLTSVKSAANKILSELSRLDILVCNAGICCAPAALSKDGYEIHFATNHLGHALLTKKLLPLLQASAQSGNGPRIITASSTAWRGTPPGGIVFDKLKTTQDLAILGRWLRYGQSKLANLLYARELAERYPEILSFSITPGVVSTGMVTGLGWANKALVYATTIGQMQTPEEGTYNHLWAMTAAREGIKPGLFYEPVGQLSKLESKASRDVDLSKRLWDWTEEELAGWV
ncbi:short-chain dehydrogenase TIC 32, chloroplastic [Podospora fimiseda]|uniref:Short-chain dehydrogenase TIC 32, chloroplastic n=1 Tax=Podospora fimiseda TaxID=252190 RepID=A0AAN6YPV0_9PEZI|nr:short-chain dehydrogenase TIC 32, chloroplastic [Podospora fimiseda]